MWENFISISIFRVNGKKRGENNPKFFWRWADKSEFDDIIISSRMILDHVPLTMPRAIHYLANQQTYINYSDKKV